MKTEVISISFSGYGHNKVTIIYRNGKEYSAVTNMVYLTDAYKREWFTKREYREHRIARLKLIRFVKRENRLK